MYWKIYKYRCNEDGRSFGDVITSICYTEELMESYKNPKFVVKIEEFDKKTGFKVIWER